MRGHRTFLIACLVAAAASVGDRTQSRPAHGESFPGWPTTFEGRTLTRVELEDRGFDLISRKPHPEDPKTSIGVRFIEVKGRAHVGDVALTTNEYKTAERLQGDYWLYVVYNCAEHPEIHVIQDPARLGWEPVVKIEHYHVGSRHILSSETVDG